MKKILFVFILLIVITGAAFAEFPEDQFGIGVAFREGLIWPNYWAVGLSLKAPYVPIFCAVTLNNNSYSIKLDYYFLNYMINPNINLDWYLGAGGEYWSNFEFKEYGFLGRIPIGLSLRYAAFDFFAEAALKLGVKLTEEAPGTGKYDPGFDRNIDLMLGVRIWF